MHQLKVIAFTHKSVDVDRIGKLHIEADQLEFRLTHLKKSLAVDELMYLSTCNRVEFVFSTLKNPDIIFLRDFFKAFNPQWNDLEIDWAIKSASIYEGEQALNHIFYVASSLDSMVVGEREIITQIRDAYEKCNSLGLTADFLRIVMKKTIEVAKQVYTETYIAQKPVSVVSLAYRKLKELNVKLDARFLIIGAGVTNAAMSKYLKKHGFSNFAIFNRTLSNAQKLAADLKGESYQLDSLKKYSEGFDVIVSCTGSSDYIITKEIYTSLLGNDSSRKIVIDLAVPNDLDPAILNSYDINLIAVNNLETIAKENLKEREKELSFCERIIENGINEFKQLFRTREVELAMSEVPRKIKEIRQLAVNDIFAKEIGQLDDQSKETLEKVLSYVEKKYISLPMKMAKEILLEK